MEGKFSLNLPDLAAGVGASSVCVSSSTTKPSSSSTRSPSPRSNSPSITEAAMRATGLVPSSGLRRSPSPCENCDRYSSISGAIVEASDMEEGRMRSSSPVGDIFSKINSILDKDNKLGFGDFLGSSAVGRDRDPDERKQQHLNPYQQQSQQDVHYGGINHHIQGGPPQFSRGAGVGSTNGNGYGFTNPQFQALNNVLGMDSLARNTQQAWFGNNIIPGVDSSINSDNCYNSEAANFKFYNQCEKFVTSPVINNCPSSSGLHQQRRHPNETLNGHAEYCGPTNLGSAGSSGINSPDDDVAAAYNRFSNVGRAFSPAELRPSTSASPTLDEALVMGSSNEGNKKQHASGSSNTTDAGSTGSRPGGSTGPRSISPESDAGYGTSYGSGLSKKDTCIPNGVNSTNQFMNSHLGERDLKIGSTNNQTGRASVEELAEVFKCLDVTSGPLNGGSSGFPSNLTLAERVAFLGNNQAINPNSNLLPGMNEMDPAVAKAVRNQQALQQLGNAVQPNHLQQPGTGIDNQAIVNPMLLNSADSSNRNSFSPSQNDLYSSEVDGPNTSLHSSVHSSSSTLVDYPSLETAAKIHRQGTALYDASCTWSGVLPPRDMRNAILSCKVFLGGVPWDITETALLNTFKPYGQIRIEWPGKDCSLVPKGYLYIIFENEKQVKSLLNACTHDFGSGGSWYIKISSRRMRNKEVQVIPWVIADSNHVKMQSQRLDPQKTVFVGALHGMLTAEGLCKIFNELFGGVVCAGVDTDKYKYPIGSGRVTFNNTRSYMKAVSAAFIEIRTGKFNKKVQVDPYLGDALCSSCGLRQGPYFCRDLSCFKYFCRSCWEIQHTNEGRRHHKPLMRNNSSNSNKTIQGFGGNHIHTNEPQNRPPRPASTNSASFHRGMSVFENNSHGGFRSQGYRDSKPAYSMGVCDIGPVGSPVGGEGGYVRRRTNSSSLCDNEQRSPISANYLSSSTGGFNHYFDGGLKRQY